MEKLPSATLFDLDETLAQSMQAPHPAMMQAVNLLMTKVPVAIISGAGFDRIERDVLSQMPHITSNLYIFPNSSSQCYLYRDGAWHMEYDHALTLDERNDVKTAIAECMQELEILRDTPSYGTQVVDREAQIAFTIVGLDAPKDFKYTWDPDGNKRHIVVEALKRTLGDGFDILTGGASTIDITRRGVNKAYGVEWLATRLGIPTSDMLYVGDALYAGGNDEVVKKTGISTRQVTGPDETLRIITELCTQLQSSQHSA
jgi:HAD superfamily hydrolase (TIGR01484 family)